MPRCLALAAEAVSLLAPGSDFDGAALLGLAVGLDRDCYSVCNFGAITQDFQKLPQGILWLCKNVEAAAHPMWIQHFYRAFFPLTNT